MESAHEILTLVPVLVDEEIVQPPGVTPGEHGHRPPSADVCFGDWTVP